MYFASLEYRISPQYTGPGIHYVNRMCHECGRYAQPPNLAKVAAGTHTAATHSLSMSPIDRERREPVTGRWLVGPSPPGGGGRPGYTST